MMAAGDGPHGIVAQVARMGDRLISTLPPAFLLLVVLNLFFLGMVMWFIQGQSEARSQMVSTLVSRCMEIALHASPPK
jgi:hypothetical protein